MSTALPSVMAPLCLLFTAVCLVLSPGSQGRELESCQFGARSVVGRIRASSGSAARYCTFGAATARRAKKVKSFVQRRRVFVVSLTTLPPATAIKAAARSPFAFAIGNPTEPPVGLCLLVSRHVRRPSCLCL
ncbi:hypothetical protein B0T18DRAFT_388849 [Schizothecium vesticola]|uniref:Secreted protein n=1 Tax=Schizothecium vesticola TaxID=314040 RepID=A0AA40K7U7_9PEZI|nr:hypothetical protein B0T18DRAFT_388849 [Schizothecium vesticola]